MKKYSALIATLIPFLLLSLWLFQINTLKASGEKVRLAITGEDPRDLLAGHFLQYRVVYGDRISCGYDYNPNNFCVCLTKGADDIYSAEKLSDCSDAATDSCPLFIKGQCQYGTFTAGIERYYFPEEYSEKLRTVPPGSILEISLDASGQGVVNEIYVNGQKILDYAKAS